MIVSTFVYQQAFAVNVLVKAKVPKAVQMTIADPNVDWGGGYVTVGGTTNDTLTITSIYSNAPYTLTVAKDAGFNPGGGDLYSAVETSTLPSARLVFDSSAQTGAQFTVGGTTVKSGLKTGQSTPDSETVTYKISPNYDDEPADDYEAQHIYTIAPN